MNIHQQTISFIGAGNMSQALIYGLLNNGMPAQQILACAPSRTHLDGLQQSGIAVSQDNSQAIGTADLVVLGVKPQVVMPVLHQLSLSLANRDPTLPSPTILSVVAGLRIDTIAQVLGQPLAIVRAVPNTPSALGLGMTGLLGNQKMDDRSRALVDQLFTAVGLCSWFTNEQQMDAVTALSGSGPAYFFLFIEALVKAGEQLGLSQEHSQALVLQTAQGAIAMASTSTADVVELRRQVTSPGGTTERAIATLNRDQHWFTLIEQALHSGAQRAKELADQAQNTAHQYISNDHH